jgi:hypothetical protein
MPQPKDILLHWVDNLIFNKGKYWFDVLYDDNSEFLQEWAAKKFTHICFACGSEVGTQRCHIVPKSLGGSDMVDNLHLLCKECHLESEFLENEKVYFRWFEMKNPQNSGSNLRVLNLLKHYRLLIEQGEIDSLPINIRNSPFIHLSSTTVAQHEREITSARTKKALAAKKARGATLGTPANLTDNARAKGRAANSAKAASNPNNQRAKAMATVLNNNGTSIRKIADQLNSSGFTTSRGNAFTATQVVRLLKQNPQP